MPKVSDTHKLLIISGPTATGKTKLATHFAKRFNGELISADSRQVYKGLDVLTGKDTKELAGIPVWLYDVVDMGEQFSVSLYRKLAMKAIADIRARGKLPIIVGGTGLYIRSIIHPPETINIPPDTISRRRWDGLPVTDLQDELRGLDAKRFARMNNSDEQNPRRLIRALEIARWQKKYKGPRVSERPFDWYWIGLTRDMDELTHRIAMRVQARWEEGALEEVRRFPMAVATGMKALRRYLKGEVTKEEAQAAWIREEVSYAKRQMTWFRREEGIRWYDAGDENFIRKVETDVEGWYT